MGGHCIAVDPWFIVDSAPEHARLIRTARNVNDGKPRFVIEKIRQAVRGLETPTIACLGLAFKANIDDLRESPALEIVRHLAGERLGRIVVAEPHIQELPSDLKGLDVELMTTQDAVTAADVLVLLVDHNQFRIIGRDARKNKVVVDTRGAWSI